MSGYPWRELPRPWIADIGSGGDPWPLANILVDLHPEEETEHRRTQFRTEGKLFIQADVHDLPFPTDELDWVRCSHVLEHCKRPDIALRELIRVSKKGEAWVPTAFAEAISRVQFPGTTSGHKWLCARDREQGWMFCMYDDSTQDAARKCLIQAGVWADNAVWGYGTELRIAWGWGNWPSVPVIQLMMTVDEPKESGDEPKRTDG